MPESSDKPREVSPPCDELPFRETKDPAFGERAAESFTVSLVANGTLALVGCCPRCHGSMELVTVDDVYLAHRLNIFRRIFRGDRSGSLPTVESTREVPMICLCTSAHPGRPEGRKGCGAYWVLTLVSESS